MPPFDIKKSFEEIQNRYRSDPSSKSLNILLLGESGSGKTFLARTCPGPVLIDSFDRGGSKGLRKYTDSGQIMVDHRWEDENPLAPTAFQAWCKEMKQRNRDGFFDYLGTYMLDSATTFSAAIMNSVLKEAGIPGQTPRFTHDYGPQKTLIMSWIRQLLNMPCNFILTGHLETQKDEASGRLVKRFLTTGKLSVELPLLFDEVWVMDPKNGSGGVTYRLLTQSTGTDMAASRLAQEGLLDKYEEPDLTKLMKKVGWKGHEPKGAKGGD